jgi:regulator of sirC expression with transglutaminase-like and TPR domain
LLVLRPGEATELRDRGLLAHRLGWRHQALFDLKRYLFLAPKSTEATWIEQRIEQLEQELLRLN